MKSHTVNNNEVENKLDLLEVLQILVNSKNIIIVITLIFSLLAFIYSSLGDQQYKSVAIIEIGNFISKDGEENLIEPMSDLINYLEEDLIYTKKIKNLMIILKKGNWFWIKKNF